MTVVLCVFLMITTVDSCQYLFFGDPVLLVHSVKMSGSEAFVGRS